MKVNELPRIANQLFHTNKMLIDNADVYNAHHTTPESRPCGEIHKHTLNSFDHWSLANVTRNRTLSALTPLASGPFVQYDRNKRLQSAGNTTSR